jgi:hypothetical protein
MLSPRAACQAALSDLMGALPMPHALLTESFCKRLLREAKDLPAGAAIDYFSIDTKKLSLRVRGPSEQYRNGLLSWRFVYRFDRKQVPLTFGHYPTWSSAEVHAKARRAQVILDEKRDPRAVLFPRLEPSSIVTAKPAIDTVQAMFRRYAAEKLSEKSNSHRINTVGYFERHVLKAWDGLDVHSLTKRAASDLIQTVKTENGPIAANRLATALSAWGSFMVDAGVLDVSPFIRLPKSPEQERQRSLVKIREDGTLDLDEIIWVWRAAVRLGGPPGRFVQLLCTTPFRRDEAAKLERGEVTEGTCILPAARCKNGRRTGRDFSLQLGPMARAILMECPDTGRFYFSKSGKRPLSGFARIKEDIDKLILAMRGRPLSPAWCFHDLRRALRTALSGLKVDDAIGEAVLNHLPEKLLRTYTINSLATEKRQALRLWSDYFSAALANPHFNAAELEAAE